MSFSEEEHLSQMIKSYLECSTSTSSTDSCFLRRLSSLPDLQVLDHHHNPAHLLSLQEVMEETSEAETEIYGEMLFYLKGMESSMKLDKLKKWILFRLEMDNYEAHLCKTSWSDSFGPPSVFQFKGDYEYIDVMMKDNKNGCKEVRLIVDIDFKEQFGLARPTPTYQELISALPLIFVGTEEKLEKLINLICTAAKQSFKENGLHIPPWRKASYMHSKWLSENCKKISFSELNLSKNDINGKNAYFQDFRQVQKFGDIIVEPSKGILILCICFYFVLLFQPF